MKGDARLAAIETLVRWQGSGRPIDPIMEGCCRRQRLEDPRDIHLTMALVYGVLRWQRALDAILADFSKQPLGRLRPAVLAGLRIGLFQLFFLDRIPPAAAVHATVEAVKAGRQPRWIVSFVNGVLRNVLRRRESLPLSGSDDRSWPLAVRLSHPDWLVERWLARYGRERTKDICQANNQEPPLTLRVNTARIDPEQFRLCLQQTGIEAEPGEWAPAALNLRSYAGSVADIPGFSEGLFLVQDEAAQLVTLLLASLRPGLFLDACAGLGGKTAHLAEIAPLGSRIVAVEPDEGRRQRLGANLARLQLAATVTTEASTLQDFAQGRQGPCFDAILLDAPCSGTGVVRRHPEIRWNRTFDDISRLQRQQLELLAVAAPLLRPEGVMVYATCSIEPEEGEEAVAHFLANHPDFALTAAAEFLPAAAGRLTDDRGFFRTLPTARGMDGFFAARLVKLRN